MLSTYPTSKDKASQWLGQYTNRFLHGRLLISNITLDMKPCHHKARYKKTKIQITFHELPTDAHSSLCDSMLDYLMHFYLQTNAVFVTQLCVALEDSLLKITSWTTPVQDLIQQLGPKNNGQDVHLWPLLEGLTVLPEEMGSRNLQLGANRRAEVLKLFTASTDDVLRLLDSCLNVPNPGRLIGVRLLRCFLSRVSLQAVTLHQLASFATLGHVFSTLSSHQSPPLLHEAAPDAVCALLQVVGDQDNDDESGDDSFQICHPVSSQTELRAVEDSLIQSIKTLEPAYHLSVAEEDSEKSLRFCRIFAEIAEAPLRRMIDSTKNINDNISTVNLSSLLDLVLTGVCHHDYEVAEVTFGFWYRLSEDLYHIERLIGTLCRHRQMKPDHEGVLQDRDDFVGFRSRISELVKVVVFIVGSASVIRQSFHCISAQDNSPWEVTKADLSIMQAVAKNILPDEREVVPSVCEALIQVPETDQAIVRFTILFLLDELGEWIDKHPCVVEQLLRCVLRYIHEPSLAVAAENSLEALSSVCRDHGRSQLTLPIRHESAIRVVQEVNKVCYRLREQQLAFLSAVMDKFQTDKRTMERCCRTIGFALRLTLLSVGITLTLLFVRSSRRRSVCTLRIITAAFFEMEKR